MSQSKWPLVGFGFRVDVAPWRGGILRFVTKVVGFDEDPLNQLFPPFFGEFFWLAVTLEPENP